MERFDKVYFEFLKAKIFAQNSEQTSKFNIKQKDSLWIFFFTSSYEFTYLLCLKLLRTTSFGYINSLSENNFMCWKDETCNSKKKLNPWQNFIVWEVYLININISSIKFLFNFAFLWSWNSEKLHARINCIRYLIVSRFMLMNKIHFIITSRLNKIV